jgi:hypothetical protein
LVFSDFKVGDNYHLRCSGTIETDSKDEEIKLEIMLGSTAIHTTTYISLDEVSTRAWELEMDFSLRTVDGVLTSNSQFLYTKADGRNDLRGQTANSEATVDTTTPQTMTATATWRDADSNNRLVVKQFLVTKTY